MAFYEECNGTFQPDFGSVFKRLHIESSQSPMFMLFRWGKTVPYGSSGLMQRFLDSGGACTDSNVRIIHIGPNDHSPTETAEASVRGQCNLTL